MNQPQPTAEQLNALREYAREHGRRWKADLNHDWMTGRLTGELVQVRNTFGPSWLTRFKFPEPEGVIEHGTPPVCPPHNNRDGKCSACGKSEQAQCNEFETRGSAELHLFKRGWRWLSTAGYYLNDNVPGHTRDALAAIDSLLSIQRIQVVTVREYVESHRAKIKSTQPTK
jgi:hypothetical protein